MFLIINFEIFILKPDGSDIEKFFPTQLGSAIFTSSFSPDEGLLIFAELNKARKAFVLDSDLHIVYLVCYNYF